MGFWFGLGLGVLVKDFFWGSVWGFSFVLSFCCI